MPPQPELANYSVLSEYEESSDSDWLDIASNRDTDTESVISRDDQEGTDDGRPSSRSSFSQESAREGGVERWEGVIEDSGDESEYGEAPLTSTSTTAEAQDTAHASRTSLVDEDPAEEQRLKAALDQSMMSTLSASRSSSHVHSSVHSAGDLRLSFPDPLTSSRDDLNRSYDDVSQSEVEFTTDAEPLTTDAEAITTDVTITTAAAVDVGSFTVPEVPQVEPLAETPVIKADLAMVLYGYSSAASWSFVDKLLDKAVIGAGFTMSPAVSRVPRVHTRRISENISPEGPSVRHTLTVVDKTVTRDAAEQPSVEISPDRPSLAIIFLPSSLTSVPDHTFYLPVLVPPSSMLNSFSKEIEKNAAQHRWASLGIPSAKVLSLGEGNSSIMDASELDNLEPEIVYRQMTPFFRPKKLVKVGKDQIPAAHIMTVLIFLLSILLGYSFNDPHRAEGRIPTPTVAEAPSSAISHVVHLTPNQSTSASPMTLTGTSGGNPFPLVPSSLKDFALAVINPAPAPVSTEFTKRQIIRRSPSESNVGASTSSAGYDCPHAVSLVEANKASTDVVVRPTPSSPSVTPDIYAKSLSLFTTSVSSSASNGKGKAPMTADESYAYALSTRIVGSLSEIFDIKALVQVVHKDVKELVDALDELMQAIGRQAVIIIDQSKSTAKTLRQRLEERNNRAHERARQLRDIGTKFVLGAGEQWKSRALKAKEQAKVLRTRSEGYFTMNQKRERRERRKQRAERRANNKRSASCGDMPLELVDYVF
ncbi:hypothetical protein JAAARDRAFT_33996 [Jaapia argillacea MUCL 33604]|uniref:Uncharacterized protein n=1 Tax=Jaapia argillacea MUCL 33604 TaxID=933084 RepID=A0A067Q702_9AGAM|nr:hypothetical protein JAAARDRAFT_33996 [Jaapia argillacea MUCL 33604]